MHREQNKVPLIIYLFTNHSWSTETKYGFDIEMFFATYSLSIQEFTLVSFIQKNISWQPHHNEIQLVLCLIQQYFSSIDLIKLKMFAFAHMWQHEY